MAPKKRFTPYDLKRFQGPPPTGSDLNDAQQSRAPPHEPRQLQDPDSKCNWCRQTRRPCDGSTDKPCSNCAEVKRSCSFHPNPQDIQDPESKCYFCKKNKRRCDGKQDQSCSFCIERDQKCTFNPQTAKLGKNKCEYCQQRGRRCGLNEPSKRCLVCAHLGLVCSLAPEEPQQQAPVALPSTTPPPPTPGNREDLVNPASIPSKPSTPAQGMYLELGNQTPFYEGDQGPSPEAPSIPLRTPGFSGVDFSHFDANRPIFSRINTPAPNTTPRPGSEAPGALPPNSTIPARTSTTTPLDQGSSPRAPLYDGDPTLLPPSNMDPTRFVNYDFDNDNYDLYENPN